MKKIIITLIKKVWDFFRTDNNEEAALSAAYYAVAAAEASAKYQKMFGI